MAATNPFRVSDLIAKYGWKVMPYLSNLGSTLLAEAQVLFVDSGHTNALDADDTEHGHSFEKPLATIDYAIGLCTAAERSVILAAPGHTETIVNAQVDFDVSDVTCIGIGDGSNKAAINFGHANSSVDIGANNIHLINLRFIPSITDILIGVDIEAAVTGTIIENCDFAEGDSAADEFIAGIEVKAGCDNTKITGCLGRTKVASAGAVAAVYFNDASDNCIVEKCRFIGNYSTAAIVNDTGACTDLLIDDLTCKVKDNEPGIEVHANCTGIIRNVAIESTGLAVDSMIVAAAMSWFNNFGVTADGTAGAIIGGGEVQAALNTAVPEPPTTNSLNDILHKDGSYTYDNTSDSLEAIADAVGAISSPTDVTDAVPNTPTGNSLQDILSELDGANTYDNTTDSLEAISNFVRTGVTLGAGINLDHLMKTAVVDEQDMSAEIATGSALAHILVKAAGGDVDDFDPTTDSLEAIADAVTGFTTAVSTTPTARSVQDILEKDGTGSFDDSTDSLEAIADFLIDADLDKLTSAADGGGNVYPDSVVQESVIAFILSKSGNPVTTSYDNTTDSLEAIRDNQQTAARAAIDDAELDHLCELDGATQVYPENAVNDSIIAKMLCKGDPATITTYDCTTDSQEAISDLLRTGTAVLTGIQLDTLAGVDTSVAADGDLTPHCLDGTVLAHIMSATKDTSTYKCTTDSLEAISVAMAAGTGVTTALGSAQLDTLLGTDTTVAADGDLTAHAVDGSIAAHIMSATANTSTYQASTDSLEAIAVLLAAVSADSTYIADGALPAAPTNDSLASFIGGGGTALGTRLADSASIIDAIGHTGAAFLDSGIGYWQEKTVQKTSAVDSDDLFDVTGGNIQIISLVGRVTTVVQGQQVRLKIVLDATTADDDRDFSTQVDLNGDAKGTLYVFSAANAAVLTPLTGAGTGGGNPQWPWFCAPGVIETVNADGVATGAIEWSLTYVPLETGVTVAASG